MNQAAGRPTPHRGTDIASAVQRARRHSARVRLLKRALPLAALLLVAAFVARSWMISASDLGFEVESTSIEGGKIVMSNPVIEGFTNDDRPYSMTARRALQPIGGVAERIDLEGISARLPIDERTMARISAENGVFDRPNNVLEIDGDLHVETDDGMNAVIADPVIDLDNGAVETDQPVDIVTDGTRIAAESMSIEDKGARMVFERRVRVSIDSRRIQAARQAQGD